MTQAQLSRRLTSFGRYGASKFGADASVALLRLRRRALQAASDARSQLPPGRYAVHLVDAEAKGSGIVAGHASAEPTSFAASLWVRAIVALGHPSAPPELISMYPVPERPGAVRKEAELMALADA